MSHNIDTHYFFYLILVTIFLLGFSLIAAIVIYGNNSNIMYVITTLAGVLIIILLIFKSYLKNKPATSEVFDLIPCRFNLMVFGNNLRDYCRRCNSAYLTLIALGGFTALAASMSMNLWGKVSESLNNLIGSYGTLIIAALLVAPLIIQATVFALTKRESNTWRIITGILFGIGCFMGGAYLIAVLQPTISSTS